MKICLILCMLLLSQFPKCTVRRIVQRPKEISSSSSICLCGTVPRCMDGEPPGFGLLGTESRVSAHWRKVLGLKFRHKQFVRLPIAYEEAGTVVSFQSCREVLCAHPNWSQPCPPAHCNSPFPDVVPPGRAASPLCLWGPQRPFHKQCLQVPKMTVVLHALGLELSGLLWLDPKDFRGRRKEPALSDRCQLGQICKHPMHTCCPAVGCRCVHAAD